MIQWREWLSDERMLDREDKRDAASLWSAVSDKGMVVCAHYRAAAAGVEILSKGGNAVDAAVATSLALGVVESAGSGLGGMAMMMIYQASSGRVFVLDGPCRAPIRAIPEAVAAAHRKMGYKAVAVPTNAAVLDYALRNYGTLTPGQVLEPAVRLAETGFPISPLQYRIFREYIKAIKTGNIGHLFLGPGGTPLSPGAILRQPVLARTLRRLAQCGFVDFYTGEIGKRIAADMAKHGGFICEADLADIPWPTEREPLSRQVGEWVVHTLPPPGGGAALLQMLQLFLQLAPGNFDPDSPEAAVLFASIIHRARLERKRYSSAKDAPDLAGSEHAIKVAREIREQLYGSGETTHLCTMDSHGNMVSMTQSIERSFGAKVGARDLGFIYNGYMKAFKIKNKRHPHFLRPGAVARSNATPTIVMQGGIPCIAVGSTGSERLASGIFQVLVRLGSQSPFQAVAGPRLHCTPEKDVLIEAERFSGKALQALEQQGFHLEPQDPWGFTFGGLHLLLFDGKRMCGVAEPRRDGAAASFSFNVSDGQGALFEKTAPWTPTKTF
ncbi:MAG: gamma-glutamyltransferase, partial [Candidatus Aminicenantes bacterium]